MAEIQQRAQVLTEEFQKLQTGTPLPHHLADLSNTSPELQTIISARQKLESQQQENKGVKRVSLPSNPQLWVYTDDNRGTYTNLSLSIGIRLPRRRSEHL